METRRLSWILGNSPARFVTELAAPVMAAHSITIIRPPEKTLVMVKMRETVAGAKFYLGEMLASEAMVELEGFKGFALMAGDDMDKVLSAAVLDAAVKGLPEREALTNALEAQEKRLLDEKAREKRLHARSRVRFDTLNPT
jgi:alpha-D-ribose 1-methylphosphonate 5-triphosphate synthase subunit PhnG